ncbi:uncharacterized protein LOC129615565 [Condylostylus longicornis]|uniref:uncharacterized protein LOC129615565 n=1 Tax=Condylostylus longicornis TaxID=2530218 RepID=UPI00244E54EC|nr:uncharacterized protein LOC129615565 [Condylostylus longicornis]
MYDEHCNQLFENLPNLQVLHIKSVAISDIAIQAILKNCKKLINLSINGNNKITNYGFTGIDSITQEKTGNCISELKNLKILCIRDCHITHELQYELKFNYLKTLYLNMCFKNSILCEATLETLQKNCPTINNLTLYVHNYIINGNQYFDKIIELIIKSLDRGEIKINYKHNEVDEICYFSFTYTKYVRSCYLSCKCNTCSEIEKLYVKDIKAAQLTCHQWLYASQLPEFDKRIVLSFFFPENLNLAKNGITNATMIEISKLENLKSLNINYAYDIDSYGLLIGIGKNKNYKLIDLKCEGIRLNEIDCIQLFENLPNLEIFHCRSSVLCNIIIQTIIKNCKKLIDLRINGNDKITDYGFTGIDLITKEKAGYCISELEQLQFLHIWDCQITYKLLYMIKLKHLKRLYLFLNFQNSFSLDELNIIEENCPRINNITLFFKNYSLNKNINLNKIIEMIKKLEKVRLHGRYKHNWNHPKQEKLFYFSFNYTKYARSFNMTCKCEICANIDKLCKTALFSK